MNTAARIAAGSSSTRATRVSRRRIERSSEERPPRTGVVVARGVVSSAISGWAGEGCRGGPARPAAPAIGSGLLELVEGGRRAVECLLRRGGARERLLDRGLHQLLHLAVLGMQRIEPGALEG